MLQHSLVDAISTHAIDAGDHQFDFKDAVQSLADGQPVGSVVQRLLDSLTKEERLGLLDGDVPFWPGLRTILSDRYNRTPFVHGRVSRLSIPGICFTDGPRGIVMGNSTAFPVSMARGATWDIDLEQRIGRAIGLEGRAQGANYYAGVCINLPRHPAWGRVQETYGEDPILLGQFGAALTTGVRENLMVCVKHFALNSMENARFRVDVQVDDAALHEVYLPHFKKVIEAGADSVMSSYNSVRGEWAGQNKELLVDILRKQWGFDGFVLSDFIFGLRDAVTSIKNGLDIEAPFSQQRSMVIRERIASEELKWSDVNNACTRILRKQAQHVLTRSPKEPDASVVFCDEHRKLAREAAAKSMVLLKNKGNLLPLQPKAGLKVALIGRLVNQANTGDRGSSHVHSPHVITAAAGIQAALPYAEIWVDDSDSVDRARTLAKQADIVICLVGYDHSDEGEYVVPSFQSDPPLLNLLPAPASEDEQETYNHVTGSKAATQEAEEGIVPGAGGDRRSLRLRDRDVEIISAVSSNNSKVIVSVVTAGAVIVNEWIDKVSTVLISWYSGSEGGNSLADVLLGAVDVSGRLPFSIPKCESHLPHYEIDATTITYDKWFGQRLLDKSGHEAQFPLGYGLSYTSFAIADFSVSPGAVGKGLDEFFVRGTVLNTGKRSGRHVVQIYGLPDLDELPTRVLLGFGVIDLDAGQSKSVRMIASIRPLLRWTSAGWIRPGKTVGLELSSFHGDPNALSASLFVGYA